MNKIWLILGSCLILASCKTGNSIFGSKSQHEQYGQKLTGAGLDQTTMGRRWFEAASRALLSPVDISIPYKERGYFAPEMPRAVGLRFAAKRGQLITIRLDKNPEKDFTIYLELWRPNDTGSPILIEDLDTSKNSLEFEVEKEGAYLLRLQPQLLQSGEYTLALSIGPSLGFPVAGKAARIGSYWGADRDAGARSHEGIDIFAPRGTPVVAAADGRVSSVRENNLGGKVVFLRPGGKNLNLYYAHLDKQLVEGGQSVKKGDTLGLVGNTGNARTTPPHLHFGIYADGGAIDPLDFVNPVARTPAEIPQGGPSLKAPVYITQKLQVGSRQYAEATPAWPLARQAASMRVLLPDGQVAEMQLQQLKSGEIPIRRHTIKDTVALGEGPRPSAPVKALLLPGESVSVLGYFSDFGFVEITGIRGWVPRSIL